MEQTTITNAQGTIAIIRNESDIESKLNLRQNEFPQITVMKIPKLGKLTFGISEDYGFVEFMAEDQDPPYRYANNELLEFSGEFVEFDSGGTTTPIPKNQCLPIKLVKKIIIDSFLTKKLPNYINWHLE